MSRSSKIYLVLNILLFCLNGVGLWYVGDRYHKFTTYKELYEKCRDIGDNSLSEEQMADYLSDNPTGYSTLESSAEVDLLNKYLANAKIYFEWGSGGSTFEALKHKNLDKVYSIENSVSWLNDFMYRFDFILKNEDNGRLELIYVNTGETGDWGYPKNIYEDYSRYPETFSRKEKFQEADLILVDGRYRAACLLQTLLYAKPGTLVLLHDSEREWYHPVYQFFDEVEQADKLRVFRIKEDVDKDAVRNMYERYKRDMR